MNWCQKLVLVYGDLCNRILHPSQYSVKLQVGVAVSEKGGDIRVQPPRFEILSCDLQPQPLRNKTHAPNAEHMSSEYSYVLQGLQLAGFVFELFIKLWPLCLKNIFCLLNKFICCYLSLKAFHEKTWFKTEKRNPN